MMRTTIEMPIRESGYTIKNNGDSKLVSFYPGAVEAEISLTDNKVLVEINPSSSDYISNFTILRDGRVAFDLPKGFESTKCRMAEVVSMEKGFGNERCAGTVTLTPSHIIQLQLIEIYESAERAINPEAESTPKHKCRLM